MKKRIISIIMSIILPASMLCGCGASASSDTASSGSGKIYMSVSSLDDTFRKSLADAAAAEAKTLGVTLDIGDANNIHPLNKKEVGRRLSLLARKIAYNNDLVASGPVFESMSIKDETIHVKFTSLGGGLVCRNKYGYVNGFQIAGANQKFYWAKATIEGDRVIVSSENVKKPVAVRYAWADNPDDVNLFNFENLPAIPFRTDNWSVLTTNKK